MANGRLEVLLVEAEGIKDADISIIGFLNCLNPCKFATKPYVHILYGNQKRTSSVGKKGKGKKQEWNEKFMFEVEYPDGGEDQEVYNKIILRIMDKHMCFSSDEFVGETTVYVKDIVSLGAERGKFEVEPRIYRVVDSDHNYSGQISLAITFLKSEGGLQEDLGGWKESVIQD